MIAVVGPLTSLAVGGVAARAVARTPDGLLRLAVGGLAGANLLVGVLNLVPGLPLDGGRVLKAASGAHRQHAHRDHRGRLGRPGHGGRRARLAAGDGAALRQAARHHRLRPRSSDRALPVDRRDRCDGSARLRRTASGDWSPATWLGARSPSPTTCPSPRPYAGRSEAEAGSIVTVTSAGQPVGLVNEAAVLATPEDRRPWVAVSTVSRTLEDGLQPAGHHQRARTWSSRSAGRPPRSTSSSRTTARSTGCWRPTDVDRAFRDGAGQSGSNSQSDPTSPRGVVGRPPRPPARRGVGAADRHQGPPPQLLPRARASGSSPTRATSTTTS